MEVLSGYLAGNVTYRPLKARRASQTFPSKLPRNYCSLAYSALASFGMGMSGSASFQSVKKSL